MKTALRLLLPCAVALAAAWWFAARPPPRHVDRRFLMDTLVTITAYPDPDDPDRVVAAVDDAFRRMQDLEAVFSTYRPEALLARANAAGRLDPGVHPDLAPVLRLAAAHHAETGGRYEPGLGRVVDLWGFGPSGPRDAPPDDAAIQAALPSAPFSSLGVSPESTAPLTLPEGVQLDLGGLAKGYAVDEAVRLLKARGVPALVDAGGDMACTGPRGDGRPWRVGIRHPRQPQGLLGVLELSQGAVATSGDYERVFVHQGQRYHHLIDPRTGRPGRHQIQATVRAATCARADALATALFLCPDPRLAEVAAAARVEALVVGPGGPSLRTEGIRVLDEVPWQAP